MRCTISLALVLTIFTFNSWAAAPNRASDPVFAEPADVADLPRVLLIGDSISMGYTRPVRELLQGKANVHRVPENASGTRNGLKKLTGWLGAKKWDVIHVNFGLHDAKELPEGTWHSSPEEYERNVKELMTRLKATGAKVIWATTTPVPNGGRLAADRRFANIDKYNAAARRVMKNGGVRIDDLHAAIAPHVAKVQIAGDVHFNPEGSKILAEHVAASIEAALHEK